ncbi:pleckstrin homology domain-containing family A member 7-like [Notothenia coriiceps]|uniref:Pleckstrin homology domain-containing family A member 7-like n=1 Tax=Notothenia coriiceps TaxID=8208 RepID=A0A6I9P5Y7_9TELE|nr:PREDICTED: pleckstrin homology domain-containing family A member 7-like [Notothenia coriiceps]
MNFPTQSIKTRAVLPEVQGLSGPSSRLNQSNHIASYVTLRRGPGGSAARERPKSALELLSSPPDVLQLSGAQPRGRMTAEEQLERMKRHQKALVRERKRNLSQERSPSSTAQRSSSSSRLPTNTSDPPASVRYPPRSSSSRHRELHLHHHCCYTLQPPGT